MDNFVNMEEIMDEEDHIEQISNIRLITKIHLNMNKNRMIQFHLNEHRVTLEDSLINFLDFGN